MSSSQRGLKSGLSGRTGIWHIAFRILRAHNRWLFGFGYRAGDRMVGTIDNGYVQLLFESGLIAGFDDPGKYAPGFLPAMEGFASSGEQRLDALLHDAVVLMIVYFLNNISTRYLFSFGSPFSLCVLLPDGGFAAGTGGRRDTGARDATGETTAPSGGGESLAWNRPRRLRLRHEVNFFRISHGQNRKGHTAEAT